MCMLSMWLVIKSLAFSFIIYLKLTSLPYLINKKAYLWYIFLNDIFKYIQTSISDI